MTEQIVKLKSDARLEVQVTAQDVRDLICQRATEQEVALFLAHCKSHRLDPFTKEAYLVKYGDKPAAIITNYTVFNARAQMHDDYLGIEDVTEAKTLGLDSNVTYTVKADDDGTGFTVEYGFNEDADRMFEVLGSDYGTDYVYKQNGSYVYRDVKDDDNAEQLGMTLYFVIKIVSVNA